MRLFVGSYVVLTAYYNFIVYISYYSTDGRPDDDDGHTVRLGWR